MPEDIPPDGRGGSIDGSATEADDSLAASVRRPVGESSAARSWSIDSEFFRPEPEGAAGAPGVVEADAAGGGGAGGCEGGGCGCGGCGGGRRPPRPKEVRRSATPPLAVIASDRGTDAWAAWAACRACAPCAAAGSHRTPRSARACAASPAASAEPPPPTPPPKSVECAPTNRSNGGQRRSWKGVGCGRWWGDVARLRT